MVAGCASEGAASTSATTSTSPTPDATATSTASLCGAVPDPADGGPLAPDALVETSGLVASRRLPGVLWAHNDSGGGPELFAVGLDGADLGQIRLEGAPAVDWEDIALLPGRAGSEDRVVVGDIGDNLGAGTRMDDPIHLYLVDEPVAPGVGRTRSVGGVTAVELAYADGARDAETVMADPDTGDVFVVSKQWDGAPAGVYRVPADTLTSPAAPATMERVASVAGTEGTLVTGGDVSDDGRAVVLRTYTDVRIWDRVPARSVPETLTAPPTCVLAVIEPQGEAVAVLPDGSGLVTVSEGAAATVHVRRGP